MSDKPTTDVLGALPRTRPHRRSGKRAERPGDAGPAGELTPQAADARETPARKPAKRPATKKAATAKPAAAAGRKAPARGAAASAGSKAPARGAAASAGSKASARGAASQSSSKTPRAGNGTTPRPRPRAVADTGHGAGPGSRLRQPPQPAGTPSGRRSRKPVPASGGEIFGTAVQAAAELAEIGLSVSARALRNAVSRLPKP